MLDDYSQDVISRILALRPDWAACLAEYPYRDEPQHYGLIQLPAPGDRQTYLVLYTADGEITLTFGHWEWQYPNPSDPDMDEVQVALAEAACLLRDEHLVASYWSGDEWLGSRLVGPFELPALGQDGLAANASHVRVLSWSGAHDQVLGLAGGEHDPV